MKALLFTVFIIIFFSVDAQTSFNYKRKLKTIDKEDWYSVILSPDIFSQIRKDYSDIRLYQINGKDTTEIPYLLKIKSDETKETTVELPVLNKSKNGGKLYLTFQIKKDEAVNYLNLEFEENNFNATVRLEGSHDQKEWFEIVDNQRILSIQNEAANFKVTTINFPLSNYKYLRTSITSDKPLTFLSSSFKTKEVKKGNYRETPVVLKTLEDKQNKQTIVELSLKNVQPVSRVQIKVSQNGDYYRAFSLESFRDSVQMPNNTWIYNYDQITNGYLTSFRDNDFEFYTINTQKMRLTIYNADNAPLTIESISASGPTVELIAKLKPGDNFLFYGNSRMMPPSYDLVHFENQIPQTLISAALEQTEIISKEEKKVSPLFENQIWLWGIMSALIILLGFATVRMMGKK